MIKANFHMRAEFGKVRMVAEALVAGAARLGDQIDIVQGFDGVRDGALIIFGIGGMTREIHDAYAAAGRDIILIDKGYTRDPYFRVSVNGFQPLHYMAQSRPDDRWRKLGMRIHPIRQGQSGVVLIDGGSNKYALWAGLGDWIQWGRETVAWARMRQSSPVVYRPRPSHNPPPEDMGCEISTGPLADDLRRARLVITHGGNLGFDAIVHGIPVIALGPTIAKPLDSVRLDAPVLFTNRQRWQWLADLAYCQWTVAEYASGEAWADIRRQLRGE